MLRRRGLNTQRFTRVKHTISVPLAAKRISRRILTNMLRESGTHNVKSETAIELKHLSLPFL